MILSLHHVPCIVLFSSHMHARKHTNTHTHTADSSGRFCLQTMESFVLL